MIVSFKRGDVNGDRVPDNVYLTGTPQADAPTRIQNTTLVIQDGRTGLFTNVPLKENTGFEPSLILGDFNGDRVDDIMIVIQSGMSGGETFNYIYSDLNNIPLKIFDFAVFNSTYQYDVNYQDYYKVAVTNKTLKIRYFIDLTYKGTEYLTEIYDSNGKLKAPITGWVDGLSGLYPIDYDGNGVYELLGYQRISGRYHADGVGTVLTALKWDGRTFGLAFQNVAIEGMSY